MTEELKADITIRYGRGRGEAVRLKNLTLEDLFSEANAISRKFGVGSMKQKQR